LNNVTGQFCFPSIPMAMEVSTLALVIWYSVAGVCFDPSANGTSHPISPLNVSEAELMQYLIPDLSFGPSLNT
jgi:hypothetical protein